MRILFLSTWFPYPPDNGAKLRVYYLLRALAQAHEVTLVSFAFDTACPQQPGDLAAFCRDIHVVPLNPFTFNRAGALRTFLSVRPVVTRPIPAMRERVVEVLRAHTFDAVIASTEVMGDYADLAPAGVPRILEEHNSMRRWAYERYAEQTALVPRARCWLSWRKRCWYEARAFSRYALITMVSDVDHQATLAAVGNARVKVAMVPNGVDCRHNYPDLAAPRPNSLIYNGALTYDANYDAMQYFLAEIYPLIKQAVPDVTLTITGSTKGVPMQGLQLDPSVHFTGYVDDIRLPVAQSAVCIIPLRYGGGSRLKIIEAMALGVPVVATAKGAEGLAVVNGEHVLLGDTPAAFAGAVQRALHDQGLRAHLRREARALVKARYDWEHIGAQFVTLVDDVIAAQ